MDRERIERYKSSAKSYAAYVLTFIKWLNIGLLLGVLAGLALQNQADFAVNYIKPFGTIYLNLSK